MYDYGLDDAGVSHLHEDEEDAKRREVRRLFVSSASGNIWTSYAGIKFGVLMQVQLITYS